MKFTRIITFSIIGVLSLGTLVTVAELNEKPVNRTFKIEDMAGDRSAIGKVELENVMKVSTNKYEKVVLSEKDVRFFNTKYDVIRGVGEKVLNNKELYRNTNNAITYENKDLMMTVSFDEMFRYNGEDPKITVAKKDKKTNKVTKNEMVPSTITHNMYVNYEYVMEIDNKLFYVITTSLMNTSEQKSTVKVFGIDKNSLKITELMSVDASFDDKKVTDGYTDISSIVSDENYLYAVLSNQDGKRKLLKINPTTKKISKTDLEINLGKDSYVEKLYLVGDNFYVHTSNSTLYNIDKKSMKMVFDKGSKPGFIKNYEHVSAIDQVVKDGKIYVTYVAYKQGANGENCIAVFDDKAGKILYEGKLPNMSDRGVGMDYKFVKTN